MGETRVLELCGKRSHARGDFLMELPVDRGLHERPGAGEAGELAKEELTGFSVEWIRRGKMDGLCR
jgi:hypothetical protein